MKIAIDISPLAKNGHGVHHRVRGTGFYIEYLTKFLRQYYPQHTYIHFTNFNEIPHDTDIVHYPYFEPFFLTLPLRLHYKTVVTVHDLTPLVFKDNFPPGVRGSIKWQVQKYMLSQTAAIITDSEASKKDVSIYAGVDENKIHAVHLAVGEEFRKLKSSKSSLQAISKKYMLPDKFALYVGDVTWNKNLPRLIEAAEKAKVPLVMVGKALLDKTFDRQNPWNQDLVSVQESAGKSKYVVRLGYVSKDELVLLYNMAKVFVMPSLYEGFGLPVLEAMRCGCPVITARQGSLPEVGGDGVLYVDPYDSDNIAKIIRDVFINKDLQLELSKKGYVQANKFTWKKTVSKTIDIYENSCR